MRNRLILLLCIYIMLLTGCTGPTSIDNSAGTSDTTATEKPKETEFLPTPEPAVQTVFKRFPDIEVHGLKADEIPVTISPDHKTAFIMQRVGPKSKYTVLKGEISESVDLVKLDVASGKRNTIVSGIPFITTAKWNSTGDRVAFCGGQKLTVYEVAKGRLLLKKALEHELVTYFGWSPDGKTIYTEHPHLPNGDILQLDDEKLIHKYETDERFYFKGVLDEVLYFATYEPVVDEKDLKYSMDKVEKLKTVVADKDRNIIKELPAGRFRDSYANALLQTGEENFALYYISDINKPENSKMLTQEYVFDAKFIYNGNIAAVIKGNDVEKNVFTLCLYDNEGNALSRVPLSGSALCLSPDGKTGYINGSGAERDVVDFPVFLSNIEREEGKYEMAEENRYQNETEEENIYRIIRGAMDTYYKNEIIGSKDLSGMRKYFTNSSSPEQWAHFDMQAIFDERDYHCSSNDYNLTLVLHNLAIKQNRASALVSGSCCNSFGTAVGLSHSLELIKTDGTWYVTGFSTFPESKQAAEVAKKVEALVTEIRDGKLFNGVLKDREIKTGQVQFWQMSEPHLASDVGYANYCKVFLKVMEEGNESIYKLILDKKNYKDWTPVKLDKNGLSWLY